MAQKERKTEMVLAVDLRERRMREGLSVSEMADILEISDPKHVYAIETGRFAITLARATRAARRFGALTVDVQDVGRFVIIPEPEKTEKVNTNLRPGEAAWVAIEEDREALESLELIQKALLDRDRERLVQLYEQAVCDPVHAASLVAAALDRLDPKIGAEARENHKKKLAAKGLFVNQAA